MSITRFAATALMFCCLALGPEPARADSDTHYQDYLVGERAAGMGGAYTALANEATGAHYNPAGIIHAGSSLLQLSMSAYKLRLLTVQSADICGQSLDHEEQSFFSFPGSLGIVFPFNAGGVEHAIGFTLVVPSWERSNQTFQITDADCGSLKVSALGSELGVDRVFHGGLTYAVRPMRWLQLGITVGTAARSFTYSGLSTFITSQQGLFPVVNYLNGEVTVWSLFLQAGAIVEPLPGLRFGLNFVSPQLRLAGKGRLDIISTSADPTDLVGEPALLADDAEWYWKVPYKVTLGVAYAHGHLLTVALDVSLHGQVDRYHVVQHPGLLQMAADNEVPQNKRNMIANVNLGIEGMVWRKLLLRFGIFSNLTSFPDSDQLKEFDHVHRFGATIGGTYLSSASSALSFALQAQLGDARAWSTRLYSPTGKLTDLTSDEVRVRALDTSLVLTFGGSYDIK